MKKASQPIGIFDSGIGGLTIANAIAKILPHENIIYFGDTAYLPYGDKSAEIILQRAVKIADFLAEKKCKLIVVACNSASAVAFDLLQNKYVNNLPIINVIDPIVGYVAARYANKTIGLIGTSCTVNSEVYLHKINNLHENIQLKSLATAKLASMIETNQIDKKIIYQYLQNPALNKIDGLILGCTHYPLIKDLIEKFYEYKVDVFDAPQIVARTVKDYLTQNNLLNAAPSATYQFYVSRLNDHFASAARYFFGIEVDLKPVQL